ncbi:MAG: trypsin-like peptidase domain-containing protein, partial [Phycisphaerales bacterium]|nr:trypsin-like peptidase domain-containing protein [Phycisphaerales bacterium]
MRRFVSYGPAFVVLLAALVTLFAAPVALKRLEFARSSARITLARQSLEGSDILEQLNDAVRNVAKAVEPSVVHIDVQSGQFTLGGSTGSGWVFDDDGHVVTNAHVVSDAQTITVQFSNGRRTTADVVGMDVYTDIAVLKIADQGSGHPARRASGERLRQGERVFAFGSPFGFKFSMSEGIVSGLGRDPAGAVEVGGFTNFIQTDCAVNPGNSGGPLVDIYGRVVGMNVAIATGADSSGTTEGQSAGISFAIPLATIESRVGDILEGRPVRRAFLGIRYNGNLSGMVTLNRNVGEYAVGLLVDDVTPDTPAARAGLQPNDIIAEIDGQRVIDSRVLRSIIAPARPGDTIDMRVIRDTSVDTRPDRTGRFLRPLDGEVGDESRVVNVKITLAQFPDVLFAEQMITEFGVSLADSNDGVVIAE